MLKLRPDQEEALEAVRAHLRQGKRRVLLQAPTGFGKTVVASTMAKTAVEKGKRVWMLVHRRELVRQVSKAFTKCDIQHGIVSAGYPSNRFHAAQVCSIPTLVNRLDMYQAPDVIIFDECIAGDSVIETDRGPMEIQNIRADGVKALCQIEGELHYRTISKAWKSGNRETLRISLSNGKVLVCTPDHRIYLDGKWTESKNLKVGHFLASPAEFAHADAEPRFTETIGEELGDTRQIIVHLGLDLTGKRDSLSFRKVRLFAHADAEERSGLFLLMQKAFGKAGVAKRCTQSTFTAMTSALKGMVLNFLRLSADSYSEHCLVTGVSGFQTHDPLMQDSHGRMARFKQDGSITKPLLCGDLVQSLTLQRMKGMATSASECILRAFRASRKSEILSLLMEGSASLVNGSIRSVMKGLHGGTAMMGIFKGRCSSIQRVTQKKKTSLSEIGLAMPQSTEMGKANHISDCEEMYRSKSPEESSSTCRTACNTNSPFVEKIEIGPTIDVYDLTVDDAHNFFANGVLVHNCHHISAGSWAKIAQAFPEAVQIGLSATPIRLDGVGLGEFFDELVEGPPVKWLIEHGALAQYRLLAPASNLSLSGVHKVAGDYNRKELDSAVAASTITGDAVEHYLKYAAGTKALMFHVSIARSIEAVAKFKEAGIEAEHIDGETDPAVRDAAIERFENGTLQVVSNVNLFSEGTDIAGVQTLIDCAPSMSLGSVMQRWGRVLRPAPGKVALILDHAGNSGEKHGYPDTPRQWSLEGKTKRKKKDPEDITLRRCPVCMATLMGYVAKCDACGHVFESQGREVEEVAGELQEVINPAVEAMERKREQQRARSEDELVEIGRQRGMKRPHLWARHVMRARGRPAR